LFFLITQKVPSFLPFLFGTSLLVDRQNLGTSAGTAKGKSQGRMQEYRWGFKISVEEPAPTEVARSHDCVPACRAEQGA